MTRQVQAGLHHELTRSQTQVNTIPLLDQKVLISCNLYHLIAWLAYRNPSKPFTLLLQASRSSGRHISMELTRFSRLFTFLLSKGIL